MKNTRRILALALVLAVSLLLLASCSAKGVDVAVRLIGPDETALFDDTVTVTTEEPYAIDATTQALIDGELSPVQESDGFITALAGIESTQTDGWLMYINGEMAMLGANEQPVIEGDVLEWKYVNYDETFAQ
ncbi:MAG: DUF4430 domain-containing protein [Acetanaerobacterium sp.]